MGNGLTIINDSQIQYNPIPREELGVMYCDGFSLNLDEIRVIAICPRLPLDDERLFVLLVDKKEQSYPLPDSVLTSEAIKFIESKFGIESIINIEWEKFDYEDHYGFKAKVIYPQRLYGQNLYRKSFDDWTAFKKGLSRLTGVSHITSGSFTFEIQNELNSAPNKT